MIVKIEVFDLNIVVDEVRVKVYEIEVVVFEECKKVIFVDFDVNRLFIRIKFNLVYIESMKLEKVFI